MEHSVAQGTSWSNLISPPLFSGILDELDEGVALLGPELERPGPCFIYANPAFGRITGHSPTQVVSPPLWKLCGLRTDTEAIEAMLRGVRDGRSTRQELILYTSQGDEIVVDFSARPIGRASRLKFIVCVLRDRTHERRMEAIASASNLADGAATIFAGIRHELGNPINSIKVALSLVRDRLDTFGREKTHAYLGRALAEIDRIEFLLRAMRSYSALERVTLEDVRVAPFLADFTRAACVDLTRRNITLRTHVTPPHVGVRADPRALYQVLLNLVLNAADAVQDIEAPLIEIMVRPTGSRVLVCVRDNGRGITPQSLKRIFDPFYTTKPQGSGLGLGIARRLLASMSATISVESQLGRGTSALIEIDAADT